MAKSDQLTKWIVSKESAISKKQENISKRTARIEKLKQEFAKHGIQITDEDLLGNPYNVWNGIGLDIENPLFDKFYSMHDAMMQNASSEKDIRSLQRDLAQYQKELDALQSKERDAADRYDNNLEQVLTSSFQTFYNEYLSYMKAYHEKKWKHFQSMKAEWKKKQNELSSVRTSNWMEYNRKMEELSHLSKFLRDESLRYDKMEDYINQYVIPYLNQYWVSSIKKLVETCDGFNLNKELLKVTKPIMTDKGFEVVMTDGGSRQIYARLIWAAENSLYVTPHFRYIVTERH